MWNPKLKLRCYKLLLTVWNMMDRLNCLSGTLNKAVIRKWAIAVGPFLLEDSDRVTPGHSGMRWREGTTRNNVLASSWTPARLDLLSFQLRVEARGLGVGSTHALWSFYITPNTAKGISSRRPPLLTHHRPPTLAPTLHFANGNSLTGFRISVENCEFFILLRSIVPLIPSKGGQKPGYRVYPPPAQNVTLLKRSHSPTHQDQWEALLAFGPECRL